MIPFDPLPPRVTSGIRLGSPAVTTRGFRQAEMEVVGRSILQVVFNIKDEAMVQEVGQVTAALCSRFPVPGLE
jgi:glycine hydroxymethyltransferase